MADVENVLSIEEIMRKYMKEWVAVKVVKRDEVGQLKKAKVLAYLKDKYS